MTCEDRDNSGRGCRNKPVTLVPWGHRYHDRPLCKKHADARARKILEDNRQLVWALNWNTHETQG